MNYTVSIWLPSGSERYNESGSTPAEAAKKALKKHEKSIEDRLRGATGRYKRDLESHRVPRLIEVWDSSGHTVGSFSAKEV